METFNNSIISDSRNLTNNINGNKNYFSLEDENYHGN
jgi:hypothetical protein